jgi:hypothetical protein
MGNGNESQNKPRITGIGYIRMVLLLTPSGGETFGVTCARVKALGVRLCRARVHIAGLPGRTADATVNYARTCVRTCAMPVSTLDNAYAENSDSLGICEYDAHRIRVAPQQIGRHDKRQVRARHLRRLLHALLKEQL